MTTDQKRLIAIGAVRAACGDDCYRAEQAFAGLSKEQMEERHGQSGKTRREVLEGFRMRQEEYDEVIAWLQSAK